MDNPRSAEGLHLLNEGRFRKQRRGNYVTYTERIDEDGLMHNFCVRASGDAAGEGFRATYAEAGEIVFEESSGRRYLELRGGSRYQGEPGSLALEEITFALYGELIPESQNSLRRTGKVNAIATEYCCAAQTSDARCIVVAAFTATNGAVNCVNRTSAQPYRCAKGAICQARPCHGRVVAVLFGANSGARFD